MTHDRLEELRKELENYEELMADSDEDCYVARGNGFCDSKYSSDFLEGKIAQLQQEIQTLERK